MGRCNSLEVWRGSTHGQQTDCIDGKLIILAVSHDCGSCSSGSEIECGSMKEEEEEEEEVVRG